MLPHRIGNTASVARRVLKRLLPGPAKRYLLSRGVAQQWYPLGEFVTFRAGGFVQAPTPSLLLARHNYEVQAIHRALEGIKASRSLEIGCGYGRLSPAIAEHS